MTDVSDIKEVVKETIGSLVDKMVHNDLFARYHAEAKAYAKEADLPESSQIGGVWDQGLRTRIA